MNSLPTNSLDLAIFLYKNVDDRSTNGRNCEGVLSANQNFQAVINQLETYEMLISEDSSNRRIEFQLPNGFFFDFDEFFSAPSRRISSPEKFYLANIDYTNHAVDQQAPTEIMQYFQATELFKGLRSLAHELKNGNDIELLFVQKEKISVLSKYSKSDLRPLENLDAFLLNFINSEIHKDQKSTIVKSSLIDFFNKKECIDFSKIIINFSDLFKLINSSYQLYVSEFSFLKIKAEIEKEKLEFTTKLNKIFSDIQSQLLAIPAALVLIGGQMENSGNWSIKNILIWLGTVIFSLLMNLLIKNQRHTLIAIKVEIDQQKDLIKTKHQAVADKFIDIYEQLNKRYAHQHKLLITIDFLVALALFASTFLLLVFSVDVITSILCMGLGILTTGLIKIEIYFKTKYLKNLKVDF